MSALIFRTSSLGLLSTENGFTGKFCDSFKGALCRF